MQRRLEREKRAGRAPKHARLYESDYLLGVHDTYRVGALRFRLDDTDDFLDNRHDAAAPPFVQLRELAAASLALERDKDNTAKAGDEWLRMLIAPGGSLGGARPKASVVDPDGHLWIAKFPGAHDEHDVSGWELVVQTLARACGLQVPEALASRFVFNMLVSNTDDHPRNHGFLLLPGKGWRLSGAYDMNPVPDAHGLRLNVSEADNALDIGLALSVAPYFRVKVKEAQTIIKRSQAIVRQWPKIASSLRIPKREQQRMASAFRLAGC